MSEFYGDEADFCFLYPTKNIIDKIKIIAKNLDFHSNYQKNEKETEPIQKLNLKEMEAAITNWLWGSYADEVIDAREEENGIFAGYFIFINENMLSILICYANDLNEGAVFWGLDIMRLSEKCWQICQPDFDHPLKQIKNEVVTIKEKIEMGTWEDLCCSPYIKEQLKNRSSNKYVIW